MWWESVFCQSNIQGLPCDRLTQTGVEDPVVVNLVGRDESGSSQSVFYKQSRRWRISHVKGVLALTNLNKDDWSIDACCGGHELMEVLTSDASESVSTAVWKCNNER